MDVIFHNLWLGLEVSMVPTNLLWVFIGGLLGTIIGMLPGLGPATGVAILIPITYGMAPATALITMCAVYYGAMFGGSRASIMINTPGDASAIVSCFDGYPMAKQGRAGAALAISAIAASVRKSRNARVDLASQRTCASWPRPSRSAARIASRSCQLRPSGRLRARLAARRMRSMPR